LSTAAIILYKNS